MNTLCDLSGVRESELAALTLVRATCLKRVADAALLAMLRVMMPVVQCSEEAKVEVVPALWRYCCLLFVVCRCLNDQREEG